MLVSPLIKNFSSNQNFYNSNRIFNLSNCIFSYFSNENKNFTKLNKKDSEINSYGWFVDSDTEKLYKIKLIINDNDVDEDYENVLRLFSNYGKKYESFILVNTYLKLANRSEIKVRNKKQIYFSVDTLEGREHYILQKMEPVNKKLRIRVNRGTKIMINKKRKRVNSEDLIHDKKIKMNINWREMISASSTRNYLLNDTLADWLKEYNITSLKDIPKTKIPNSKGNVSYKCHNSVLEFIFEQGNNFESDVIDYLTKNFNLEQVADTINLKFQVREYEMYLKTLEKMNRGVDLIYQGVLWDLDNKAYGCPDLLVRSDKIPLIFNNNLIESDEINKKASLLNGNYHYRVIDIKKSVLTFNSDGITLRNEKSIPAYKGQICIYNNALKYMTGYLPPKAYILGTQWKYTSKGTNYYGGNCLKKLGTIDFVDRDFYYYEKTKNACNWLNRVRKEGHKWKIYPKPSIPELYPNMINQRDDGYLRLKKELAEKISEITNVWMCGILQRRNAFSKEVYSWRDPDCNSTVLFGESKKKSKRREIVDKILDINRSKLEIIRPKRIEYEGIDWKSSNSDCVEFFIDFETLNSNMNEVNLISNNFDSEQKIFLVGVGFVAENNEWDFKYFLADDTSLKSEREIFNKFWNFINEKCQGKQSKFYHWTGAEPISYKKCLQRHNNIWPQINFLDLYKIFYQEPVVINGALSFSLKSVARALYKHDLIETCWNDSNPCQNGFFAMILATRAYKKPSKSKSPIFDDIIKYNEIDCKVLWEILVYLRENHL